MTEKKKNGGALLGAAFLMATSAIGPGFLTQTSTFTGQYQASFGFVILVSVILAAVAQLNIWQCALCNRASWTGSGQQTSSGTWISGVCTDCIRRSGI